MTHFFRRHLRKTQLLLPRPARALTHTVVRRRKPVGLRLRRPRHQQRWRPVMLGHSPPHSRTFAALSVWGGRPVRAPKAHHSRLELSSLTCPAPRLSRVQHHALTSPPSLVHSRAKRVAWRTVPAGGSPHLHSVPSDVLRPGPSRPARLDIVTRVCRGGNRRAPDCGAPDVASGMPRVLGGPAFSAVACAVEPPMGERPGTQAAARYRHVPMENE